MVREHFVWDRELRGFVKRVMPSRLKCFVIQYRISAGKILRGVIGCYSLMTGEMARKHFHEKLAAVFKDISQIAHEACSGEMLTVADVCDH
jgi:hypothetical protein